jgi:hypothetical protein
MELESMQRHWTDHELATHWSLSAHELALLPQRDASSRLGMAASLKFFQLESRFPTSGKEIPAVALQYLAMHLAVDPAAITDYDWQGRTGKRYRSQLRAALGVRPITVGDFRALATWLREEMVPWDHEPRHLQAAILARCRTQHGMRARMSKKAYRDDILARLADMLDEPGHPLTKLADQLFDAPIRDAYDYRAFLEMRDGRRIGATCSGNNAMSGLKAVAAWEVHWQERSRGLVRVTVPKSVRKVRECCPFVPRAVPHVWQCMPVARKAAACRSTIRCCSTAKRDFASAKVKPTCSICWHAFSRTTTSVRVSS